MNCTVNSEVFRINEPTKANHRFLNSSLYDTKMIYGGEKKKIDYKIISLII